MLTYLAIRDFAIIDELSVELRAGFTVLTGETGAGKSILIQALHLLLGGRASTDMIRTDKDAAEVEMQMRPPPGSGILERLRGMDLLDGESVTVRRVVSRSGRNRVFVNGRIVNLSALAELTRGTVDISGQHEHVQLTDEDTHRQVLDDYGGLQPQRAEVAEAVAMFQALDRECRTLRERDRQRAEREEYLRFSLDRILQIDPQPNEDEELGREIQRLRHAEKLTGGVETALGMLYEEEDSAVDLLGRVATNLAGLVQFDSGLQPVQERVQETLHQIEDMASDLRQARRSLQADPARLEEAASRLAALKGLLRAHGPDLPALLDKKTGMEEELASLHTLAESADRAEREREAALEEALRLAAGLSRARRRVAKRLAASLESELASLAMKGARVVVEVSTGGPEELDAGGLDRVRFLLSANPGEEVRPLARVASGGELSRVLLALKAVLSGVDPVPTYVFDEVDAGVGGAVAAVIGARLASVAERHQVICITHLPQIAAHAGQHDVVSKRVVGKRTVTEIARLDDEERVEELARMAGGRAVTDKARSHARELLRSARTSPRSRNRRKVETG